jgi:hypothetical protein
MRAGAGYAWARCALAVSASCTGESCAGDGDVLVIRGERSRETEDTEFSRGDGYSQASC